MLKKKSTLTALALFIYITVMGLYFIPRHEVGEKTEPLLYMGFSYIIVVILWFVLRKKEAIKERREKENNEN